MTLIGTGKRLVIDLEVMRANIFSENIEVLNPWLFQYFILVTFSMHSYIRQQLHAVLFLTIQQQKRVEVYLSSSQIFQQEIQEYIKSNMVCFNII